MSEARAITNFIGNGVATIFLANNEGEFDHEKMKKLSTKKVFCLSKNNAEIKRLSAQKTFGYESFNLYDFG
jgi:hypothetical protein